MFRNFTRFSQFQKSLGIPRTSLRAEYLLTQKGLELKPVIIALTEWGDKWVQPGPVVFQNESDGQPVELRLRRVGADAQVAIADVVARRR